MSNSRNKLRIVFLGTPQIACSTLKHLACCDKFEMVAVVTQPDKPSGRGHHLTQSAIKTLAQELNIPVYQPVSIRKDSELIEKLKSLDVDFFVTVAFGQILSQEVLDIPRFATVNLHASLLPEYRGANPIARAISDGKTKTGVTTMLTSLGVDEGDIILTEDIEITDETTTLDLAIKVSEIAPDIMEKSLIGLADNTITPQKQNSEKATFAHKFTKEEMTLDLKKPACELHNFTRALAPKPAMTTTFNGMIIKILKTSHKECFDKIEPSKIIDITKQGILLGTTDGILVLERIKPEGKKEMGAYEWSCGAKITKGDFWK